MSPHPTAPPVAGIGRDDALFGGRDVEAPGPPLPINRDAETVIQLFGPGGVGVSAARPVRHLHLRAPLGEGAARAAGAALAASPKTVARSTCGALDPRAPRRRADLRRARGLRRPRPPAALDPLAPRRRRGLPAARVSLEPGCPACVGGVHVCSGGDDLSIRSSSASSSLTRRRELGLELLVVRGPMMAAVTAGCGITKASATSITKVRPARRAARAHRRASSLAWFAGIARS